MIAVHTVTCTPSLQRGREPSGDSPLVNTPFMNRLSCTITMHGGTPRSVEIYSVLLQCGAPEALPDGQCSLPYPIAIYRRSGIFRR